MEKQNINESERLKKEIGTVLKSWCEAHNVSVTALAAMLEVKPPYVSALFGGKGIGKKVAKKLHDCLGLSESYLLTGQGLIDDVIPSQSAVDLEKMAIYQQAIQKANRIHAALSHLVDEGEIANISAAAPILGVMPSVLFRSMRYDPESRYDLVILCIVNHFPQFSLEWLLTGEGQMINTPASTSEEILQIKHELAQVRAELQQARDEFRGATNTLMRLISRLEKSSHHDIGLAAED